MKYYRTRNTAERMGSLRSRNAYANGEYSQFAMVCPMGAYYVGPINEVLKAYPREPILCQWSGGYRV